MLNKYDNFMERVWGTFVFTMVVVVGRVGVNVELCPFGSSKQFNHQNVLFFPLCVFGVSTVKQ